MVLFLEAVVLCLIFTAIVVPSLVKNPLAWAADYPPAICQRCRELGLIPPKKAKTPPAFILRKAVFSLVAAVVLAAVLVFINGARGFVQSFVQSYILWAVIAWYDALILDCLWFCHSKKVIIHGTEDLKDAYHDYGFHLKMSCIGMLLGLPVCLLTGLFAALICRFIA